MSGERHLVGVVLIVLLGFSLGNFSNETQQLFVNGSSSAVQRSKRSTECVVQNKWKLVDLLNECSGKETINAAAETVTLDVSQAKDADLANILSNVIELEIPLTLDGSSITKLQLDNLKKSHGMVISENPHLENINFPNMMKFSQGDVKIENNPKLKTIDFPKLSIVLIQKGGFEINNNPSLSQINLGVYSSSIALRDGLVITGNRNLNQISIQMTGKIKDVVNVTIKGNRKLGKAELDKLMKLKDDTATNWDIQEPGECIFPDPVQDLAEFEDCIYVDGNLVLAPAIVAGKPVKPLQSVRGNLIIKDTNNKDLLTLFSRTKVTGNLELENNAGFCGVTAANVEKYFQVDGQKNVTNPPCPTTTSTTTTTMPVTTTQMPTTARENTTEGAANLVSGNEATTEESSNMTAIIGGSVGGVAVVLIVVVIVVIVAVVLVMKKKNKKSKDNRTESSAGDASSANKSTGSQQKAPHKKSTKKNVSTSSELPQENSKEQMSTENTKLSMEKSQIKEEKSKETQEKSKGSKVQEKSKGSKAEEKSNGPKAQEKSNGTKAQEKSKGTKAQEKSKGTKAQEKSKGPNVQQKSRGASKESAENAKESNEPVENVPNKFENRAHKQNLIADPRKVKKCGNLDAAAEAKKDENGLFQCEEFPSKEESIQEKAGDEKKEKKVNVTEQCKRFDTDNKPTEDDDDQNGEGSGLYV